MLKKSSRNSYKCIKLTLITLNILAYSKIEAFSFFLSGIHELSPPLILNGLLV